MLDKMSLREKQAFWDRALGYQPSWDDLKWLSINEPGIFQLITEVMDFSITRRRWKKEMAESREAEKTIPQGTQCGPWTKGANGIDGLKEDELKKERMWNNGNI